MVGSKKIKSGPNNGTFKTYVTKIIRRTRRVSRNSEITRRFRENLFTKYSVSPPPILTSQTRNWFSFLNPGTPNYTHTFKRRHTIFVNDARHYTFILRRVRAPPTIDVVKKKKSNDFWDPTKYTIKQIFIRVIKRVKRQKKEWRNRLCGAVWSCTHTGGV